MVRLCPQHDVGFRFKKKAIRDRCRFSTGAIRVIDRDHVQLPRLGLIKTKEPTNKLLVILNAGIARITSATIAREADRWFVAFAVEVDRADPRPVVGKTVGLDRGLTSLATLSDGTVIENPKVLDHELRKLRRLSKSHARKQKGSKNRAKSAKKLARLHRRIRNKRRDFLHKITTPLARTKSVIVIEDLAVHNLVRFHHLARRISDAGWGEFHRQLAYKTTWYGSELIVADRFFPSSRVCSALQIVMRRLIVNRRTRGSYCKH